ncbi:hypothetical protein JCM10207_004887 [Rhodosporidiobolus poonsookiae]
MATNASLASPGDSTPFLDHPTSVPIKSASLAGLPIELQSRIAEYVVDSMLEGLCASEIVHTVELSNMSIRAMMTLVRDILPIKSRYVKHLGTGSVGYRTDWGMDADADSSKQKARQITIVEAERLFFGDNCPQVESFDYREARTRNILEAAILRLCTGVVTINHSERYALAHDEQLALPDFLPFNHVLDIIVGDMASKLTHLDVSFTEANTVDRLASVLRSQPNLASLSVSCRVTALNTFDRSALYTALTSMPSLASLKLKGEHLYNNGLFDVALSCPLSYLELEQFERELPIAALRRFLFPFLSTLRCLRLSAESAVASVSDSGAPFSLPRLEILSIDFGNNPTILPYFFTCRLVEFNIVLPDSVYGYTDLEPFLDQQRHTLEVLVVHLADEWDADTGRALEAWGERQAHEAYVEVEYYLTDDDAV